MNEEFKELLRKAKNDYLSKKIVFDKMYDYCITGKTDAYMQYKHNANRSNLKVRTNFIKKFIKEEVSYLLSNKITYTSKSDNEDIIKVINNYTSHWDKNHDKNALRNILSYGSVFELYYTEDVYIGKNKETTFNAKLITPRDGYLLCNDRNKPLAFLRFYRKKFDNENIKYIDVYTDNFIYRFDNDFNEVNPPVVNIFGKIPVTKATISEYEEFDTLFNELKDLVDAYQTNLSDIVNEISDYRLAYLLLIGCQIDTVTKDENGKTQLELLKEKGVMQVDEKGNAKFLTKEINDTFVQNTLNTLKKNMYEISNHIDTNEKMQSNLSGSALRNRLIGLEQRVRDSEGSFKNLLLGRLYFMFALVNKLENKEYDFRDISAKFTLNIPQDDLLTAQTLSQLPEGVISKTTGRSLFSFISNPDREKQLVEQEQEEEINKYDDGPQEPPIGDANED